MSFDVDVRKRLGEAAIACRIEAGPGLTVLFGRSGVGKTSVLNMIAGLATPDAGHVRVGGETLYGDGIDVPVARRRAGYVFQEPRLFPHLPVRANLLYGQRLARAEDRWMALDEAVSFLGLGDLLDRWPAALSGGEARRVAIGRALLSGPRFLLMDEPLSSLDRIRRDEIMTVIERVRDELALPILYVTHDEGEAARLGTRRVVME